MELLLVGAAAYVAGAFTPAVGRKIKAFFVKETQAVQPKVLAEVKAVETAVENKL